MPIQLQTAPLLILLSFLRDGVSKLNSHEPHVVCMPDSVLTLWWENQHFPTGTTRLPMPFLCVCKSGGAADIFNSPQVLGFLSKLFKAILPLKWGKEDCIGTTESPDCPGGLHSSNQAGLTIAGRTVCYRTVFILRPAPGCPPLHGNVLRGNSPAWAQQWELT